MLAIAVNHESASISVVSQNHIVTDKLLMYNMVHLVYTTPIFSWKQNPGFKAPA